MKQSGRSLFASAVLARMLCILWLGESKAPDSVLPSPVPLSVSSLLLWWETGIPSEDVRKELTRVLSFCDLLQAAKILELSGLEECYPWVCKWAVNVSLAIVDKEEEGRRCRQKLLSS